MADKKLSVKLGDFGLAKIIGEDSFTTTLYVDPFGSSLTDLANATIQGVARQAVS